MPLSRRLIRCGVAAPLAVFISLLRGKETNQRNRAPIRRPAGSLRFSHFAAACRTRARAQTATSSPRQNTAILGGIEGGEINGSLSHRAFQLAKRAPSSEATASRLSTLGFSRASQARPDQARTAGLVEKRTTAWMQEVEQCRSNCRDGAIAPPAGPNPGAAFFRLFFGGAQNGRIAVLDAASARRGMDRDVHHQKRHTPAGARPRFQNNSAIAATTPTRPKTSQQTRDSGSK